MNEARNITLVFLVLWVVIMSVIFNGALNDIDNLQKEPPLAPAIRMLEAHSPDTTNSGTARSFPERRQYMDALFAVRDEAVAAHKLFMEHFGHADDCPKKNSFFEETCPCGFLDVLNAIGGIGEKPLESVMEGR